MQTFTENGIEFKIESIRPGNIIFTLLPIYGLHTKQDITIAKVDIVSIHSKMFEIRINWQHLSKEPLVKIYCRNENLIIEGMSKNRISNLYVPGKHETTLADTEKFMGTTPDAMKLLKIILLKPRKSDLAQADISWERVGNNGVFTWKGALKRSIIPRERIYCSGSVSIADDLFKII